LLYGLIEPETVSEDTPPETLTEGLGEQTPPTVKP
jgi:hypothetical protein